MKKGYRKGYQPEEYKINCNFWECEAGCGIAGNGHCFLDGHWWWYKCPEFKKEKKG